jgi:hypothetical protein
MSTRGDSVTNTGPSLIADVSRLARLDEAVEVLAIEQDPPQAWNAHRLQDPSRDEPSDGTLGHIQVRRGGSQP